MSEVCKLLKLLLVIAMNAASKKSASALKRIKTYLRSTISQSRLNDLMILHAHKERTDNLCLPCCVNDFVSLHESKELQNLEFNLWICHYQLFIIVISCFLTFK